MIKRAKLSGQGKALFFSEKEPTDEAKTDETEAERAETAEEPVRDLVNKIKRLKQMVKALKAAIDPKEFEKLRGTDL